MKREVWWGDKKIKEKWAANGVKRISPLFSSQRMSEYFLKNVFSLCVDSEW